MELLSLLHDVLDFFVSLDCSAASEAQFYGVEHGAEDSFVVVVSLRPCRSVLFRDAHSEGGLAAATLGIVAVVNDGLGEGRTS